MEINIMLAWNDKLRDQTFWQIKSRGLLENKLTNKFWRSK